ncbi:dipeptidyl-peptidase-4 [Lishizhenia tianjinensis]|uniref:Dipeptidyl-peptidase-4 n=1 Tax=Lishizhenia tianjinensis TaxID=477690 RepID=A0A1I6XI91_9FLAO|nr:S9 family peptidase [Lishizhenia tianjinensis]SFT38030.1 dipeptidyl-peptidase-4 [Lishizhenia tianjinensis]
MKNTLLLTLLALVTLGTANAQSKKLDVETIWKDYTFQENSVAGFRSTNDGEHYTQFKREGKIKSIYKYSFTDENKEELIVDGSTLFFRGEVLKIDNYFFNADESKMLFTTQTRKKYRRSFDALYYVYDLKTKELAPLDEIHFPQTLAEYSPDGSKVAYVSENNLFVKDLESGNIKQITKDGEFNKIINGTTDWVNEEEFALTKGFEWSPDGNYIAYLKFDERNVKEFTLNWYKDLYPTAYTYKYPKAGEDNSKIGLYIAKTKNGKSKQVDLTEYEYIPRFSWAVHTNQLVAITLNRHQNRLQCLLIDAEDKSLTPKLVYQEEDEAYVEIDDNLEFLPDGLSFIRTSEKDGFNHIYQIFLNGEVKQITKGNWDVIEYKGYNAESKDIYFTSAQEGAMYKALYKTNIESAKTPIKLSANRGYNHAEFSTGMKYYINRWSDANTPTITTLHKNNGEVIRTLEDNAIFAEELKLYNFQPKEFFTLEGANGDLLNAWIIKPDNFDSTKQYPVYFNIYCGPGSNMVLDKFDGHNFAYHQLLAQSGYLVVSVDTRGTMYRGAKFKKSTYLQLGNLESDDLVAAAKNFAQLPYVDENRVGIQGWSFGGTMTTLSMLKGNDVFKMGIAVAPVTHWKYYDNIYTERFMRTPAENQEGYENYSPVNLVKRLEGKFFLIHGAFDDNVHHQNTMELINAFVDADKQFDLFIYPNKNHGIYGGNTRNHLFKMMYTYTLEHL